MADFKGHVQTLIDSNDIMVFSKSYCPYSKKAKELLKELKLNFQVVELDVAPNGPQMQNALRQLTGQATVPNVFVGGRHIGGFDKTSEARKSGLLATLVAETEAKAARKNDAATIQDRKAEPAYEGGKNAHGIPGSVPQHVNPEAPQQGLPETARPSSSGQGTILAEQLKKPSQPPSSNTPSINLDKPSSSSVPARAEAEAQPAPKRGDDIQEHWSKPAETEPDDDMLPLPSATQESINKSKPGSENTSLSWLNNQQLPPALPSGSSTVAASLIFIFYLVIIGFFVVRLRRKLFARADK